MQDISVCPNCGGKLQTINSRKIDGTVIRKKRCISCKKELFTKETTITRVEYNVFENDYQHTKRSIKSTNRRCDVQICRTRNKALFFGDFAEKMSGCIVLINKINDDKIRIQRSSNGRIIITNNKQTYCSINPDLTKCSGNYKITYYNCGIYELTKVKENDYEN